MSENPAVTSVVYPVAEGAVMRLVAYALVAVLLVGCGNAGDDGDPAEGSPTQNDAGASPTEGETTQNANKTAVEWTDASGDMWKTRWEETRREDGSWDAGNVAVSPEPEATGGDIREVSVRHEARNLVIQVEYTDLPDDGYPIYAVLETDTGTSWEVFSARAGPRSRRAYANVTSGGNSEGDCRAASASVDPELGTAVLRVPRSCLGVPRWIRLYLETQAWATGPSGVELGDSAMDAEYPASVRDRPLTDRIYASPTAVPDATGPSRTVLSDPAGDVEITGWHPEDPYMAKPAPPGHKRGDIIGTTVEHTASEVRARVSLAELEDPATTDIDYLLRLTIRTEMSTWTLDEELTGSPEFFTAGGGQYAAAKCDGLTRSIDLDAAEVTLRVPRTCVADPAWVQVAVLLHTDPTAVGTVDDGNHEGGGFSGLGEFSPRLFATSGGHSGQE